MATPIGKIEIFVDGRRYPYPEDAIGFLLCKLHCSRRPETLTIAADEGFEGYWLVTISLRELMELALEAGITTIKELLKILQEITEGE